MRILHTSDWHLGIQLHKHSLQEDQRFFIAEFLRIVEQEAIDVVLLSGDIYDTNLATKEAMDLFDEAMCALCLDMHKQVIVIAGNHDSPSRLSMLHKVLGRSGLHICGKMEATIQPISIDDIDFFAVPFFHKETIANIYEKRFASYEDAMMEVMDDIRSQKQTTRRQIVLAHAFVHGASVSESERFVMVGGSDQISKDVFHDIDYVALGHLHRPQKVSDHVYYSGSPLAYSFSELHEKQVNIIDTETMDVSFCKLSNMRDLIELEGTYEEILLQLPKAKDAYVKIVFTDIQVNYEILAMLREHLPYVLSMQGRSNASMKEQATLDAGQMDVMRDEDILKQYFLDYQERDITKTELTWFHEAQEEVDA